MKNKLLCFLLLISGFASAQIVTIPDAVFKNWLLSADVENGKARDEDNNAMVIDTNGDNEIQQSEALLVWRLDINGAGISDATGLEYFINLRYFNCSSNPVLTTLDMTPNINLEIFNCDDNTGLEFLSFAGLSNLENVFITGTNLDTVDFTGVTAIENLTLNDVPVTNLDFSEMVNLSQIGLYNTNLININLSNSSLLAELRCIDNLLLETINIKNGSTFIPGFDSEISYNPNLNFICVDEGEESMADFVVILGNDPFYSTYCSFTPGGNYNTITGAMIFDADGNGCDMLDPLHHFVKVEINDGTTTGATFTNSSSDYIFYTGAGDFTLTPQFENNWFTADPVTATVNFPNTNNNIETRNFCITSDGDHPDVEVIMVPILAARPGFDAVYKVVYRNKGNQVLSGSVSCGWDYTVLTGITITPLPDAITPGIYTWNYSNLLPFEDREILMTLHVNSSTDTPAVNVGDTLPFTANVVSGAGTDETPDDNNFVLDQIVISSLDPNNIVCIQGESVPETYIGDYLHYVVNFENVGTAPATFVVVEHEINTADFDVSSLQVLNSSHEAVVRVRGNRVEYIFNDINLNALDHGNILFKLKSLSTLGPDDSVANKVNIYFDYNYPLETNDAETTFSTLSRGDFEKDNSVRVYPNPAHDNVTIEAAGNIQSVALYDIQGRVLQVNMMNDKMGILDISARQSGMYFVKVTTDEGVKVEKVIKK